MKRKFIEELQCPLTHSIPVEPVIGEDGILYEKQAISSWLKKNNKSPLTMQKMNTFTEAKQVQNIIQLWWETCSETEKFACDDFIDWTLRWEEHRFFNETVQLSKNFDKKSARAHHLLAKWNFYGHPKLNSNLNEWFEHLCEAKDRGLDIANNPTNAIFTISNETISSISKDRENVIKKLFQTIGEKNLELISLSVLTFDRYMSLNTGQHIPSIMYECLNLASNKHFNYNDIFDDDKKEVVDINEKLNNIILFATTNLYLKNMNGKNIYNTNSSIQNYQKLTTLLVKITIIDIQFVNYDTFVLAFSILLLCHTLCKMPLPIHIIELHPQQCIQSCLNMHMNRLHDIILEKDSFYISEFDEIFLNIIQNRMQRIMWKTLPILRPAVKNKKMK